jgi:hypothetical protein
MAKEEAPDERSGPVDVQVTIIVLPGRGRAALTKLLTGARLRAGLACVALIAAVAAGTIIAVSSGTGHLGRPLGYYSPPLAGSEAVVRRFGLRLNCARLTATSPNGAYARVDFEHAAPCGMYGNHVTLILHRVHDAWVREFEAPGWRCPMSQLPQPVVADLELCGGLVSVRNHPEGWVAADAAGARAWIRRQ